ncbi:hypothetical protein CGRA01v4_03378 [Colletotrichum graminicola]|nr:hypothetical protein CGRA01v4_03378 [Colletotrichum graminicola]
MSSIITIIFFLVVSTADTGHCLYGTGTHSAEQDAKKTPPKRHTSPTRLFTVFLEREALILTFLRILSPFPQHH